MEGEVDVVGGVGDVLFEEHGLDAFDVCFAPFALCCLVGFGVGLGADLVLGAEER